MTKVFYPLLGTGGEPGPDHMAIQVYETTGEVLGETKEPAGPVEPEHNVETHWKQRDGTLVVIVEMTDSHLRNTLRLLHRAAARWALAMALLPPPNGELAKEAFDSEVAALLGLAPDDLIKESNVRKFGGPLLSEWARRGYYPNTWWARS